MLEKSKHNIQNLNKIYKNKLFHCYSDNRQIDVFLEDYVYFSLVLISSYEFTKNQSSLERCNKLMDEAWSIFFNSDEGILQKNSINSNDLFVEPIDLNDNNIPNGNSIYLLISNKLNNIIPEKKWIERIDILSKSFHSYINSNFAQMFSYIKVLDICEDNITVTINSNNLDTVEKIREQIVNKFLDKATMIYKEDSIEDYFIICKKQTCSPKLKNLQEVENYLKKL